MDSNNAEVKGIDSCRAQELYNCPSNDTILHLHLTVDCMVLWHIFIENNLHTSESGTLQIHVIQGSTIFR